MKRSFITGMRSDDMPPSGYEGALHFEEERLWFVLIYVKN